MAGREKTNMVSQGTVIVTQETIPILRALMYREVDRQLREIDNVVFNEDTLVVTIPISVHKDSVELAYLKHGLMQKMTSPQTPSEKSKIDWRYCQKCGAKVDISGTCTACKWVNDEPPKEVEGEKDGNAD